ncbi:MAG TPA: hypothetical protein PL045_12295 [Chitinophagaceae bacterium]|nr:hypothetical protein [Chitinophagaceae bacterium]
MDSTTIFIIVFAAIAVFAVIYILTSKNGRNEKLRAQVHEGAKMQLQAYERLILLTDRIALPNLITRVSQPGFSAREMQMLLTQAIKEEFNHNITQQIYVTADAWTAVKNLKEQNLLIINQLANVLPPDAKSNDLNKILLEYLMNNKKGALHEVVSEVLSYEAKKLLETE